MTTHPSAAVLQISAVALPVVALVVVALTWLTLSRAERSALTYRAAVAVGVTVGLASLAGRLPLDLTAYAAVAAALLVPLRRRLGGGLLAAVAVGALARGDLEVHQRAVVLGAVVAGVLAAVVGTLVWEHLDPLADDAANLATAGRARRPAWMQLFTPSPLDLDHLDAIIDGTLEEPLDAHPSGHDDAAGAGVPVGAGPSEGQTPHRRRGVTRHA
ncbi:hypothetical protein V3N99_12945 [Dermatophilaceae bacterium Soc4.6]